MNPYTADLIYWLIVIAGAAFIAYYIGYYWKKQPQENSEKLDQLVVEKMNIARNLENQHRKLEEQLSENEKLTQQIEQLQKELIGTKSEKKQAAKQMHKSVPFAKPFKHIKTDTKTVGFNESEAEYYMHKRVIENDLRIIEGVGPKIAQILKQSGITDWTKLSNASTEQLRKILIDKGGKRYVLHNPSSWNKQAQMACAGQWQDLKEYQNTLVNGKLIDKV